MRIHASFSGGTIRGMDPSGDVVRPVPDLRGTQIDWFYWGFCVEGARCRALRFDFAYQPDALLAETVEIAYFGTPENRVSVPRPVGRGRCLARAPAAFDREVRA